MDTQSAREIERLEKECFALAAAQCADPISDEYGHMHCGIREHLQVCQHDKAWLALQAHLHPLGAPTLMEMVTEIVRRDQTAPEGWKLVPIEPTQEMLDEARYCEADMSGTADPRDIYIAMLGAAPETGRD